MAVKSKTASPLRAYIDEINDLPSDTILGRITLFTITENPISYTDMVNLFDELGLDKAMLPSPNKTVDAFKKATSDTKDTYPMTRDRTAHLLCRDVTSTSDFIRRQITREVHDAKNRKLGYDEAITVTFYRPTNGDQSTSRLTTVVNPNGVEKSELPVLRQVARAIEERYTRYYGFLDSQKIRAVIRGYLHKLNAIEIKGGVYFVLSTRDEELGRLAELVNRLGSGCMMHTIPVVDLKGERAFMSRVFEREAAEKLSNLAKQARELIANRKSVTPESYSKMKAEYDLVLENAMEHMGVLELSQDMTAASAEVAQRALAELANAMVDGD